MLLESVAEKGTFDVSDFTRRVDEFHKTIDGTNMGSVMSGRYTDDAMRQTWANRNKGISWDDPNVGANSITSEAAQHSVILAALYSKNPEKLFTEAYREISLFYSNDFARTQSIAYTMAVAGFLSGIPIENIKSYRSAIPREVRAQYKLFADSQSQIETGRSLAYGFDSTGTPLEVKITFDPPHLISQVYGAHCEIQQLLPCAYYLVHRYPDDFEMAVLSAVNGGGNNMARAALTGGMSGAMNGLSGIPERFITGLKDHERLLELAEKVADLAAGM
jgi:ADP-ribosyl-[dinitrogen reductase] hydrolase